MTVDELRIILDGGGTPLPGELRVTVQYSGGLGGSTVPIKMAYKGFDWTGGQLVLDPEIGLTLDEWYRTLKKGSGADSSHLGRVVEAAEAVVAAHDGTLNAPGGDLPKKIENLRKALERLEKFQKQGF